MRKQFLLGLMAMLLPLTTWAANELTVTIKDADKVVYNGDNTLSNLQITVTDANKKELTADTDYKVYLPTGPFKANQKYTVTVRGLNNGETDYLGQDGSAEITVTPKVVSTLTVTGGKFTREYDGTTKVDDIELKNYVTSTQVLNGELNDFIKCLTLSRSSDDEGNVNAGTTALVTIKAAAEEGLESNYRYVPEGNTINYTLEITKKELTLTQTTARSYNKVAFNPSLGTRYFTLAGMLDADKSAVSVAKLEYKGTGNLIDADTYPLVATLGGDKAGNYTVKTIDEAGNHVNLVIDKATLTFALVENDAKLEKTYGNEDPTWSEVFTFTPSYGSAALTKEEIATLVSITREGGDNVKYDETEKTKVVGYDITIALTDAGKTNFDLEGYDENKKPQLVINPKEIGKNGVADDDITFAAGDIKIVYKGASYQGWTSENIGVTLTYTVGERKEPLDYGKDFEIWIQGDGMDAETALTLSIVGMGNYSGSIWHGGLKIEKADLTIEGPEDESVLRKVGTGTPGDLSEHFTFTGLVGKDNDGNDKPKDAWLTMIAGNRNSSVGTYTVYVYENGNKITGNELNNYNLEYVPVEYKILSADFVLTGGEYTTGEEGEAIENIVTNTEKINQYAGLEVDVTINNLTSLDDAGYKADRWYTLVLPFDVTVREISQAFGYAIVNVPQEANDNAEDMVYGLTMGEIPAHTVMAFKIDASVDDEEAEKRHNPTLKFEKKTIVAIPEKWFEDAQGNQAIGTYEPLTDITGENQFWLIPGGAGSGSFRRASVQSYTIQPFNGYFQFAETPANARIILEEADGTTTAINAITGEVINNNAEGWYSIDGMKLNAQPTQKGVYINNGKKVVIK